MLFQIIWLKGGLANGLVILEGVLLEDSSRRFFLLVVMGWYLSECPFAKAVVGDGCESIISVCNVGIVG